MYTNYLKKISLLLLFGGTFIGASWLFLFNSGELLPIQEIVDKQIASSEHSLVGLSTRNQGYYYKKAMYKKRSSDILLLGSSRVMQFRKNFFVKDMFGLGGAMSSINQGFSLKDPLIFKA